MKKLLLFSLLAAVLSACAADKKPVIATTIDYLDYVFFDERTYEMSYYPLEYYEMRIKEMADGGIKKIYLRVNVCGTTHYPSKVSALYGENDAFHWQDDHKAGALRLIETYKHYNPLTETIRLGHKYGMEVWAWESLFDDAGLRYDLDKVPAEYKEFYKRNDGWPLLDPFYRNNMDCFAMRDPRHALSPDKIDAINRDARRNPITRIVFTNRTPGCRKIQVTAKDFDILTSPDNQTWKRVAKPFKFKTSVTPDGFNRFEITGISITDPYVKLVGKKPWKPNTWSIVLLEQRGQGEIYDSTGRKVQSVWNWLELPEGKGSLFFNRFQAPAAWEFGNRQLGFVVGAAPVQHWYYGMAEFNVPKAMKHKVDRFIELAEYPFDGFIFNIRCHSRGPNPEQYGYNPEVREIYMKRYGKDIWKDDVDVDKLFMIRAEAIADFFKNCKAHSGGRPIYLSGPRPAEFEPEKGIRSQDYGDVFGPLPWLYKRYFADGSIDGVVMILRRVDPDFAAYFTPEITGGKPIKLGIFREMGQYPNNREAMQEDLRQLKKRTDLDEIELYETLVLSKMPEIYNVIKE